MYVEGRDRGLPSGRRQRVGPISMQSEEGVRDESPAVGEAIYLRDRPPAVRPHEQRGGSASGGLIRSVRLVSVA